MVQIRKYIIILLLILNLSRTTNCRKSKRNKLIHQPPSLVESKVTKFLPTDSQVTVFLHQGQNKTFYIWSNLNNTYFSISVLACSAELHWTLNYQPNNFTDQPLVNSWPRSRKVKDLDIYSFWTQEGLYVVNLTTERTSFVNLYVSTVMEFPFDVLQNSQGSIRLTKRRRKRLTVHWNPSLVDPHVTNYCLVINSQHQYKTLCAAQCENLNFINNQQTDPQIVRYDRQHSRRELSSPKIICVGKRTHYTLTNLEKGQKYFIDLFAINNQRNFTYPHGSTMTKYDTNIKPTFLKDGKMIFTNLKKLDGKAEFIYKLDKSTNDTLEFYVMPCGITDVEVVLKYNTTKSKSKIKGFGKIVIQQPKLGVKYFLRVVTNNFFDVRRAPGIKVLATTKPSKIPFPVLPSRTEVHEYISMRKCDSITIGFHASPMQNNARYCIAVKKGKIPYVNRFDIVDHCRVGYNLKSLADLSYCKEFEEVSSEIIMERIDNLNSGESYIVYVTIKKRKGKSLGYDLLQAYTKTDCN